MTLYRHRASGTSPGESWTFTLHTTGSLSVSAAEAVWDSAIAALWTGALDALVAPDVVVTELSTATINEATDGQIARADDVVSLPGVAATEMLPFQCAEVVTLKTALANRHGMGRFYLPPFAVGTVDTGRISAASVTAAVAALNDFFTELDNGGLTPVIRDRTNHVSTTVASGSFGNVFDTQRRRRNKLIEARTAVSV